MCIRDRNKDHLFTLNPVAIDAVPNEFEDEFPPDTNTSCKHSVDSKIYNSDKIHNKYKSHFGGEPSPIIPADFPSSKNRKPIRVISPVKRHNDENHVDGEVFKIKRVKDLNKSGNDPSIQYVEVVSKQWEDLFEEVAKFMMNQKLALPQDFLTRKQQLSTEAAVFVKNSKFK
eukprot:TRINITY_DN1234_c0_g2_i11.p1 TRINITY_DN1234_c0_g2~~TRINITY_DN1234_c0_g2_i11.p1  ORF type:complete len:172 (-),score=21.79 TRINITY_DN1234_c0_g2_i11:133-648(-)